MKKDPSKKKTFPTGSQEELLKDANRKLRSKIRRLESDKKKLISENQQYKAALSKTENFLRNSTQEFSLEEILNRVKKEQSLHDKGGNKPKIEIICPNCGCLIQPMEFSKLSLHICNKCGYRKRIEK